MSPRLLSCSIGAALLCGAACGHDRPRSGPPEIRGEWPIPDTSERPPCSDVGEVRVCWGEPSPRVAARRSPPFAPSSFGFRSIGAGTAGRAVDRRRDAPQFECARDVCVQRHPRLPDDGEWECADFASVVVCHGGLPPAGVAPGADDAAFVCGARRGRRAAPGERVCVDFSPDLPGGAARGYRCRFDAEHGLARECRRDATAGTVGDRCASGGDCTRGLPCVSGRCVPPRPSPSCWLDDDCDKGSCRFGSCAAEGT